MALIDNLQVFKKYKETNLENTLFMVYMAERFYSARGDAQKFFHHLAKFIFDRDTLDSIEKLKNLKEKELKFINNRELLIKRLQSQVSSILN